VAKRLLVSIELTEEVTLAELYSGSGKRESRPVKPAILVFLSSFSQIRGQYLGSGHDRHLPNPFIFINHLITGRYADGVVR
jgi:hypothetical protein